MKKLLITALFTSVFFTVSAQETEQKKLRDSTKIEALDEVLVQVHM